MTGYNIGHKERIKEHKSIGRSLNKSSNEYSLLKVHERPSYRRKVECFRSSILSIDRTHSSLSLLTSVKTNNMKKKKILIFIEIPVGSHFFVMTCVLPDN